MSIIQLVRSREAEYEPALIDPDQALAATTARRRPRDRLGLVALLVGTTVLFTWSLDRSGFANAYYSAAAQAGAESWKAFLFGSLDAGNGITVDKPPLALWPVAVSVRLFGLSPWAILLPQALEGVATVAVLYAIVRRTTRSSNAGLLAGAAFALTPVVGLMFRYNNPDALLTLLLVSVAATTLRSLEGPRAKAWMAASGALIGAAFMAKLGQAFLVLPAIGVVHLLYAASSMARRLLGLAVAGGVALVVGGSWVLTVALWPSSARPWIGGTLNNSAWQLALGYNGIGRLTGNEHSASGLAGGWRATNLQRMFGPEVGGEIMWLVPAALLLGVATMWAARTHSIPDRVRSAIVMWLIWLVPMLVVFSLMGGIFHSYYTITMAPAIAALVAIGGHSLWQFRSHIWATRLLSLAVVVTTVLALTIAAGQPWQPSWLALTVGLLGVSAAVLPLVPVAVRRAPSWIALFAIAAALLAPANYSIATTQVAHAGTSPKAGLQVDVRNPAIPSPAIDLLSRSATHYRWAAAIPGARGAAAYELQSRQPVLALGGFKGTDPFPTLGQFKSYVARKQIHYVIQADSSGTVGEVMRWVRTQFPATMLAGITVYDVSGRTS